MVFVPLSDRLAAGDVPLVLAGPMLRHVTSADATVFVALREARTVTMRVFSGIGSSRVLEMQGSRDTVPLGANLHVVAITAAAVAGRPSTVAGITYYYDLDFGGGQTLASPGVLNVAETLSPLAYPGADLPSFALPPVGLGAVRLVHGSCRKPHGDSFDALPVLDDIIAGTGPDASQPAFALGRPHQVFLTGDQIYADDVADAMLVMLVDAATALLGWAETLPGLIPDDRLRQGARTPLSLRAGLTAGYPPAKAGNAKSHLMHFGEYACMYLFAWSPVLWPDPLSIIGLGGITGTHPRVQAAEDTALMRFLSVLPTVRRALASVPTYMIFDDHEITDDWFMNRRWVGAARPAPAKPAGGILGQPLGRRIMQNGMLAYALFQAWGNTPDRFAPTGATGEPGRALLAAAGAWRGAADDAHTQIGLRVGLPAAPLGFQEFELVRAPGAVRWDYRVAPAGAGYEVLMLDCRTRRWYPSGGDSGPAGLLSPTALAEQVTSQPDDPGRAVTIVVAQTPALGLPFIEDRQRSATGDGVWDNDVEAWSLDEDAYQRLLAAVALRRRRVVFLSGDVHYSFAARLTYWSTRPFQQPPPAAPIAAAVVQLNSSSLRNQTSGLKSTERLHVGGFDQFHVVNLGTPLDRAGWAERQTGNLQPIGDVPADKWPPGWDQIPAVVRREALAPFHVTVQPDWRYQVAYVRGTKAGTPPPALPTDLSPAGDAVRRAHELQRMQRVLRDAAANDSGREIVGLNNIAEFRFEVDAVGTPVRVVQRTWWRPGFNAAAAPITTHEVGLDPAVPPQPAPLP